MSDEQETSSAYPGRPDPPKPISPPYVVTPAENAKVSQTIRVTGGGHARHRVRVVTPGKEDALSDEFMMGGDGHFDLTIKKAYPKDGSAFRYCCGIGVMRWDVAVLAVLR